MKSFINSSTLKKRKEKISKIVVDEFIEKFNAFIKKGGSFPKQNSERFYMNNGLDKIPTLNESEFLLAVRLALKSGWILTQQPDNYQTTSYTMQKMQKI